MLEGILYQRPQDLTLVDSFGNTLFQMAALGVSIEDFTYLTELSREGHIRLPEANSWGRTGVDLAPTDKMRAYLFELGFGHSPRYLAFQRQLAEKNQQLWRLKLAEILQESYNDERVCCGLTSGNDRRRNRRIGSKRGGNKRSGNKRAWNKRRKGEGKGHWCGGNSERDARIRSGRQITIEVHTATFQTIFLRELSIPYSILRYIPI